MVGLDSCLQVVYTNLKEHTIWMLQHKLRLVEPGYSSPPISWKQSGHSLLMSDVNKKLLPREMLLTGYFLFFRLFSINSRDGHVGKSQQSSRFWNTDQPIWHHVLSHWNPLSFSFWFSVWNSAGQLDNVCKPNCTKLLACHWPIRYMWLYYIANLSLRALKSLYSLLNLEWKKIKS